MPNFYQVKILPYKPQELFCLVLDIQSYPKFLPWCKAARIISKTDNQIIAELVIQLKGFSDSYQSRVTYTNQPVYSIEVEAISGPFQYLKNSWKFSQIDRGTQVEFFIDFQMKNSLINRLAEMFFSEATKKIVNAFEERAQILFTPITLKNY
ncbi:type II toxin-antitoxin system RatA family toxin [Candidatus Tisiphia endosymbiont of Nemotelus uliginosus]|uniref:type II toxin-antitoxin system RatA family toxin n=1 Tax=Candidatus Tisiphia endosymbiont of Nemotelus uliginosus TaxID=3077926 RepID=UPI0035C8B3FD